MRRRAYELAFATAYMFAGQRPTFKEVDEVTFMRPVDVGDLLKFRSCVIHTEASSTQSDKVPMMQMQLEQSSDCSNLKVQEVSYTSQAVAGDTWTCRKLKCSMLFLHGHASLHDLLICVQHVHVE